MRAGIWCKVAVLLALTYPIDLAAAQGDAPQPLSAAGDAASRVHMHIQLVLRKLSACSDLDADNKSTYATVTAEYLGDKTVSEAMAGSAKILDSETGGAQRKRDIEEIVNEADSRELQATAASLEQFRQDCRAATRVFAAHQGPFRPLRVMFPQDMALLESQGSGK